MNSNISKFELSHDPDSAVKGADIIYTDVWASMGQKEEAKEREKIFSDYQVNKNLMLKTLVWKMLKLRKVLLQS